MDIGEDQSNTPGSRPTPSFASMSSVASEPQRITVGPAGGNSLAIMTEASRMLAEATTIQKAKELKDLALTAEDFARRRGLGKETIEHCRHYATLAEIRMGELLLETPRAVGTDISGRKSMLDSTREVPSNHPPTLAELGVTKKDSSRAQALAVLPEDRKASVAEGKTSASKAIRKFQKEQKQEEAKKANVIPWAGEFQLNTANLASLDSLYDRLPDSAFDCIFTDPPYDQESLPLYSELAKLASKVLKPGAACLAYAGFLYLPEIMALMAEHLTYRMVLCIHQPGTTSRIWPSKTFQNWRAVLLYQKPGEPAWDWFTNFYCTPSNEKSLHDWQQVAGPALFWLEKFTLPNGLVLDPFCGSGTTAWACKELGRHYLTFDTDPAAILTAQQRLRDG